MNKLADMIRAGANIESIDYTIKTKHKYLYLPHNNVLLSVKDNYKDILMNHNIIVLVTKDDKYFATNIDTCELIGSSNYDDILALTNEDTLIMCNGKHSRLVFSSSFTKYLLSKGYRIVDIKENRNNNSVIHVFDMDDDEYYNEAANFKENR